MKCPHFHITCDTRHKKSNLTSSPQFCRKPIFDTDIVPDNISIICIVFRLLKGFSTSLRVSSHLAVHWAAIEVIAENFAANTSRQG